MNLFADLERSFAAVLGSVKLPETPAAPEHSTDSTGVITGNDDIATPDGWRQWDGPQERAPLPVYPNPEQTYVDCAARLARVDAHFDGLESLARSIIAKGYEDGIFPDRRSVARERAA